MSDESIFREVDEAVRQEQLKALWDRYGTFALIGAVAIVGGVAGYKGWIYWRAQQAAEAGARFVGALTLEDEKKTAEAREAFESLAADGPSGYRLLAKLQLASAMASAGDKEKALQTYRALVADSGTVGLVRDYARLQIATLGIDNQNFEAIESDLKPLLAATNPWRHSARELIGIAAYGKGKAEAAQTQFEALLADVEAPQGLRQRAEMMLALIVKADADPEKK